MIDLGDLQTKTELKHVVGETAGIGCVYFEKYIIFELKTIKNKEKYEQKCLPLNGASAMTNLAFL